MGDLAIARRNGCGPTVVFLPGYASDMSGTKALALDGWAADHSHAFVRFDYRGCGESPGKFEDFTLEDWRDDVLSVIDGIDRPVVLVGSSMGGWLMLLAALARPMRVVGLIGIAAAPDFTEWGFDTAARATLQREGRLVEASPYGGETVTTHALWQSGQHNLLLNGAIAIHCPVRLLHGQRDADVPWDIAVRLSGQLDSANVQLTLIKDGDHRLSRDADIALLIATLEGLLASS